MKKILALSGGSVKGAWEAGALKAIFAKGFKPHIIYGISVGNLNGAFVTDKAARYFPNNPNPWNVIALDLEAFWKQQIVGRDSVIEKRTFGWFSNITRVLFNNFNGLYKTVPIDNLIDQTITADNLKKSPVEFYSGCTNIHSGDIEYYYSKKDATGIIRAIKASKAIPFIMEGFNFRSKATNLNDFFLDGGVRDVIPLRSIFNNHKDADEIVVVSVHADKLDRTPNDFNQSSLKDLSERVMDIVVNETASNDINLAIAINTILTNNLPPDKMPPKYSVRNYRKVKIHHLHPATQSDVRIDIQNFGPEDIKRLFDNGYNNAAKNFKFNTVGTYTANDFMVA